MPLDRTARTPLVAAELRFTAVHDQQPFYAGGCTRVSGGLLRFYRTWTGPHRLHRCLQVPATVLPRPLRVLRGAC